MNEFEKIEITKKEGNKLLIYAEMLFLLLLTPIVFLKVLYLTDSVRLTDSRLSTLTIFTSVFAIIAIWTTPLLKNVYIKIFVIWSMLILVAAITWGLELDFRVGVRGA